MKNFPIKVIQNLIPFPGYLAMTTLFLIWVRKEYIKSYDEYTHNHESIHAYQQTELLLASIILMAILIPIFGWSWLWMLSSIAIPFVIYIICWLIEILLPPYDQAYKNICFESEAIYNEGNLDYLHSRKPFAWLKYISNKNWPYLTHSERLAIWRDK